MIQTSLYCIPGVLIITTWSHIHKACRGHPIIPTDTLRAELAQGHSLSDIARRYRVSRRAITTRMRRLRAKGTLVAVVHSPNQAQAVKQQTHALDIFLEMVETKRRMLAAYQAMFADPDRPGEYIMSIDASKIKVKYRIEVIGEDGESKICTRIEPLDRLLERCGETVEVVTTTTTGADPRVEMRHLTTEIGNQMTQGMELKNMIQGMQGCIEWVEAVQAAIARADPETAHRIAVAVRHKMMIVLPEQQVKDDQP